MTSHHLWIHFLHLLTQLETFVENTTSIYPTMSNKHNMPSFILPNESREKTEEKLHEMVDQQVVALITQHTQWMSSLTYHWKYEGTLCICLDPHNLNRAIISKSYKAPTLNEISQWLNGTTTFKHLMKKWPLEHTSWWSQVPTGLNCTHTQRKMSFLCMLFRLKMSQDIFKMRMEQITDRLPTTVAIHNNICVYKCSP